MPGRTAEKHFWKRSGAAHSAVFPQWENLLNCWPDTCRKPLSCRRLSDERQTGFKRFLLSPASFFLKQAFAWQLPAIQNDTFTAVPASCSFLFFSAPGPAQGPDCQSGHQHSLHQGSKQGSCHFLYRTQTGSPHYPDTAEDNPDHSQNQWKILFIHSFGSAYPPAQEI